MLAPVSAPTIHLRPTAPLAERALLPGDPGRALMLARALLDTPKMFNHHRGLWGYTGAAADGELLTIQSTGMGGPSAAIVVEELASLGLRRAIRVGTCGALDPALALGDVVVARETIATDGASRALGAGERVGGAAALTAALEAAANGAAHGGTIVTTDLFYEPEDARATRWAAAGAIAVEMEAAAVFRVAELRGVEAACVLAVSDLVHDSRERIDDEALERAGEHVGRLACAALARV